MFFSRIGIEVLSFYIFIDKNIGYRYSTQQAPTYSLLSRQHHRPTARKTRITLNRAGKLHNIDVNGTAHGLIHHQRTGSIKPFLA